MVQTPVRFALVGFGAWGRCHAEAIAKTPGAELVAIAAASESTREAAQQAYPAAVVSGDYRHVVSLPNVDVVDVVVPSHLHFDVASCSLTAGKHVLLEKPMCLEVEQCSRLIELARQKQRVLAVGHEFRLSSLWGRAKQLIDQGLVGRPQYVLVELSRRPYRLGSDGWRFDIQRVGNWVLEEPIHFFDLARWYLSGFEEPDTVFAVANSRQEGHPELQDNFSAIVQFTGGAYAVVSQTLSAFEHHQTVKVAGTKGALWASWSGPLDRTRTATFWLKAFNGNQVTEVPIEHPTSELYEMEAEIAAFVQAVTEGRPVWCTGEDGRWSVAMCLAAQRSVETGQKQSIRSLLES